MTIMKMKSIIPVMLVIAVLVTGNLVSAYNLSGSGKLCLDSKKNFSSSFTESTPVKTRDNQAFKWHKRTTSPGESIGNNSLMHGRDYEPEVGLYYYRNRYYHPQLGRFLQQDPNGYEDSLNMYQAFGMNPVNFVDPFGEAVTPGVDPEVVKSAYIQFIQSGDSPDTAVRKLQGYGYIDSELSYKLMLVGSIHMEPGAQVLGTAAYAMIEFSPAGVFKDIVSLPFGKDLISGEKMKWWQKALIAAPFVAKGYKVYKARKAAKWLKSAININKSGKIINNSAKALTKTEQLRKIRIEYLEKFNSMSKIAEKALSTNLTEKQLEKVAKFLNKWRLEWGEIQKMKMPVARH